MILLVITTDVKELIIAMSYATSLSISLSHFESIPVEVFETILELLDFRALPALLDTSKRTWVTRCFTPENANVLVYLSGQ